MLDRVLPTYLKNITTITTRLSSRTSTINSGTAGNVFRNRAPEGTPFPYIIVGEAQNIDFGQTCGPDLLREVGDFQIVICGSTYASIDQIWYDVIDALKMVRQQYLPNNSATPKYWTQCIILKDSEQFEFKPIDGDQKPMLGYSIYIKAAYDPNR